MTYKRKRQHKEDHTERRKWRTRNRRRDLDQIDEDLKPKNIPKLLYQEIDEDKPGNAQFYCIHCAYYSSPLLLSGDKLNSTRHFFTPIIEVGKKLKDLPKLQENVERRKLDIDLGKLKSLWDLLKHLEATKLQLEKRKNEIAQHLIDLRKIENDLEVKEETDKLRLELKMVRDDLKTLLKAIWEVEEKVAVHGQTLPNKLHPATPDTEDKVVYEFGSRPQNLYTVSHIDTGLSLGLIDYRDPSCFFLKNEAALFEISCAYFFAEELKRNDFLSFCNPDLMRNVIVSGCNGDWNQNSVFVIKPKDEKQANYKLHLVGGASIYPFCAFHAKQTVCFSSLPLRYFTIGRQYSPSSLDSKHGLYETWQRTTSELFMLTADDNVEMMDVFEQTLATLIKLYEQLNYHFRIVYMNASSLESWECLRASIQMYSCYERKYVEVGKLSISGTYICRRLLMKYQMSEKDLKKRFMKMVSGTAVDITKLLACILEQREKPDDKFSMPECLKSQWSF